MNGAKGALQLSPTQHEVPTLSTHLSPKHHGSDACEQRSSDLSSYFWALKQMGFAAQDNFRAERANVRLIKLRKGAVSHRLG